MIMIYSIYIWFCDLQIDLVIPHYVDSLIVTGCSTVSSGNEHTFGIWFGPDPIDMQPLYEKADPSTEKVG